MRIKELAQIIESLLFVEARPIKIQQMAEVLSVSLKELEKALQFLSQVLRERGMKLFRDGDWVELVANKENAKYIEKFRKKEIRTKLTRTSLETLAIIAYQGPLTRFEIENIRGVNCVWILRKLLIRNLIQRQRKGRKTYYGISKDFLKYLGLNSVEELPEYRKMRRKIIKDADLWIERV